MHDILTSIKTNLLIQWTQVENKEIESLSSSFCTLVIIQS